MFRVVRVIAKSSVLVELAVLALLIAPFPICKGLGVLVKLDDRLGRGIGMLLLSLGSSPGTRDRFNSLAPFVEGLQSEPRKLLISTHCTCKSQQQLMRIETKLNSTCYLAEVSAWTVSED